MYDKKTLIKARKLIDTPEKWTQGALARKKAGHVSDIDGKGAVCFCALGAIIKASGALDTDAYNIFRRVIDGSISTFNDDPPRTHAEVLAAFDAAISKAEATQP